MGEARTTWWGEGRCIQRFGVENGRARDNLENLSLDGRLIVQGVFKRWNGVMEYIDVAQYRGRSGLLWMW
jgi:hypothetical protein